MARGFWQSCFYSLNSPGRIALLCMLPLGLAACGGSGDDTILPPPQNLLATAGDRQVSLSWTATPAATNYCVYVSQSAGIHPDTAASYDTALSACLGNSHTGHDVTGLINDNEYFFVVTAKDAGVESAPSDEVVATPQVTASRPLNDTGIILCADRSNTHLPCPVDGFPGQDGQQGRDANGSLVKTGAGHAGFDFTKLDAYGEPLPDDAAAWSCVQDNHTGLIWEVKVNAPTTSLHYKGHSFSWYNPDPDSNAGHAGGQAQGSCTGINIACDTDSFVTAVNAQGLCGATDWRLPTRRELLSLVRNDSVAPAIDLVWFPSASTSRNWSSSPNANGLNSAWYVEFFLGSSETYPKNDMASVTLVREVR